MQNYRVLVGVLFALAILKSYSFGNDETPAAPVVLQKYPVNDTCLNCICLAISHCDKSKYCVKDVCGMFRMTKPYWEDGGKHTIKGDNPSDEIKAYQDCANDEECARKTSYDYLTRYATDCDGNQIIDCYDYAGMHKWGPFGGCQEHPIAQSGEYYEVLSQCLCPKHKNVNF